MFQDHNTKQFRRRKSKTTLGFSEANVHGQEEEAKIY